METRKGTWTVELTATDGRACYWRFEKHTLWKVKDLVKTYVGYCPYQCNWTIKGNGMEIKGSTKQ